MWGFSVLPKDTSTQGFAGREPVDHYLCTTAVPKLSRNNIFSKQKQKSFFGEAAWEGSVKGNSNTLSKGKGQIPTVSPFQSLTFIHSWHGKRWHLKPNLITVCSTYITLIWFGIWFIYLFSPETPLSLFSLVNNSIKMSNTSLLYINITCNKDSGREQVCSATTAKKTYKGFHNWYFCDSKNNMSREIRNK